MGVIELRALLGFQLSGLLCISPWVLLVTGIWVYVLLVNLANISRDTAPFNGQEVACSSGFPKPIDYCAVVGELNKLSTTTRLETSS
jgi:hypothetical protein